MTDDPKLDAFLDALLRKVLIAVVGSFDETMADAYIPQIRAATLVALDNAGYAITKKVKTK
jgi:hypothetical protein